MTKSGMQMARIDKNESLSVDQLNELVDYLEALEISGRLRKSSTTHATTERSEAQRLLDIALAGEIKGQLGIYVENGLVELRRAPRKTKEVRDGVQRAIKINHEMNGDRYYDYAAAVIMTDGLIAPAKRAESKHEANNLSLAWLDKEYPEIMKKADARYERYGAQVAGDIEAILSGKSKDQSRKSP